MASLHPIILSGGVGARLWPLSRSLFPKQLLALAGPQTLIQDTVLRGGSADVQPPLIICNHEHRFLIAEQMRDAGVAPAGIVLEPVGRNTAPACAVAALLVAERDPEAVMLVLPADHVVRDRAAYAAAIAQARKAAESGHLVTFGIHPTRPETGYGYIQRGPALKGLDGTFAVARFVEKPDAATAEGYLAQGDFCWNSGMFVFQARAFLAELERLEPTLLASCRAAVAQGKRDLDFFRLADAPFADARAISVDYAVMERTAKAAMVPVEMGWSDVGSWEALWDTGEKDGAGNVTRGAVVTADSHDSYLRSEGPLVATVGLRNIVVVATNDAVLVADKSATQHVRKIVEQLEKSGGQLHLSHRKVYRPWGSYDSLEQAPGFQVKHIIVNPGASLSLQLHHKRAEHWVVVAGVARVTLGDEILTLKPNQSVHIPLGTRHRLENVGEDMLHLIEVQCGSYLGEDDIVRFADNYGR